MEKSEKEYFKHFVVTALLISSIILLAYSHTITGWLMLGLVIAAFMYLALFFIGLVLNLGPFKYIGRLYTKDAKRKKQALRSKQPWE